MLLSFLHTVRPLLSLALGFGLIVTTTSTRCLAAPQAKSWQQHVHDTAPNGPGRTQWIRLHTRSDGFLPKREPGAKGDNAKVGAILTTCDLYEAHLAVHREPLRMALITGSNAVGWEATDETLFKWTDYLRQTNQAAVIKWADDLSYIELGSSSDLGDRRSRSVIYLDEMPPTRVWRSSSHISGMLRNVFRGYSSIERIIFERTWGETGTSYDFTFELSAESALRRAFPNGLPRVSIVGGALPDTAIDVQLAVPLGRLIAMAPEMESRIPPEIMKLVYDGIGGVRLIMTDKGVGAAVGVAFSGAQIRKFYQLAGEEDPGKTDAELEEIALKSVDGPFPAAYGLSKGQAVLGAAVSMVAQSKPVEVAQAILDLVQRQVVATPKHALQATIDLERLRTGPAARAKPEFSLSSPNGMIALMLRECADTAMITLHVDGPDQNGHVKAHIQRQLLDRKMIEERLAKAPKTKRSVEAITLLKQILESAPAQDRPRHWFNLGYALHLLGRHSDALFAHRRSVVSKQYAANGSFNAACVYALLDRPIDALHWLHRAVRAGWDDASHMETDLDLESLRQLPRFKALVEDLRRR